MQVTISALAAFTSGSPALAKVAAESGAFAGLVLAVQTTDGQGRAMPGLVEAVAIAAASIAKDSNDAAHPGMAEPLLLALLPAMRNFMQDRQKGAITPALFASLSRALVRTLCFHFYA